MKGAVLVLLVVTGAPARAAPPGRAVSPQPAAMSDAERDFCASELDVVGRRRRVFEGQGLAEAQIARRNEGALADVADCRRRFVVEQRRLAEEQEDLAALERRAGPDATELERQRLWRELRRDRLGGKDPAALSPEDRAELAAGMSDELAATHSALDGAHARDPVFMRSVHSAVACYHGDRRSELRNAVDHEEAILQAGTGDKQRLYALTSQLRESEAVLARTRDAARGYPGGLERCSSPTIAVLAHCLAIRLEAKKAEPACESEEIQQYVRFIK